MKKRKVPPLLILGSCLILCSLCLASFFQLRIYTGARSSQVIVSQLAAVLPERTPGVPEMYFQPDMPVLEMDGTDYVAILDIPAFGVTLPVTASWEQKQLYKSPSRFYGSAYDNTLVLGGEDNPMQFGFCDKIELGTPITVTDMTGGQFTYTVSAVDRAKHAETQWLTGTDWDLTLFCHNIYSMEYIAVRCTSARTE